MGKLEKSIRHELAPYGPSLRNGHWGVCKHTCGVIPNDFKFLSHAFYDFDVESGIVTGIRLYGVGDARTTKDYYSKTEITEPIEEYLKGNLCWDDMISGIKEVVMRNNTNDIE